MQKSNLIIYKIRNFRHKIKNVGQNLDQNFGEKSKFKSKIGPKI